MSDNITIKHLNIIKALPVLLDINLERLIEACNCIIGASGSGKSF